jgi:hypothetical protein
MLPRILRIKKQVDENHSNIQAIKANTSYLLQPHPFYFTDVTEDFI